MRNDGYTFLCVNWFIKSNRVQTSVNQVRKTEGCVAIERLNNATCDPLYTGNGRFKYMTYVKKGFRGSKEINTVYYNSEMITIEEMETALKEAGIYVGIADE